MRSSRDGNAKETGVRPLLLPLAVVMAPQMTLAAVQQALFVLGPEITRAAGLPPQAVGLIGGLSSAGSVWFFGASRAVIGPLGPARALTAACVLSAVAAAAMLFGQTAVILLAAPLVGFGYAATAPAGSAILAGSTPRRLWGTLFSIRMAGVPAGGVVAGVVSAGLAAAVSWRIGLLAMTLLPLLCAGFLLIAAGRWREDAREPVRLRAVLAPSNLAFPFAVLRASPRLARLTIASLGFAAAQTSAFTFLTTYLTDSVGLSLARAGALFATMQGASFAGRVAMGFVADRLGGPRRVLVGLGFASAAATLLLTQASAALPASILFLGAAAAGAMLATWNGLFLAEIASAATDGDVGEATSASTFFTFLAYMVTPPLFGVLSFSVGYGPSYALVALGVLAAAVLLRRA